MRTNLSVEDLGTFLDEPRVAVLATLRVDGTVLLSPVYHEWREGAFNVVIETQNVKARHLRRDPRATILVAESEPPLRGVEVRGSAQFFDDDVTETTRRIVARYGDEEAEADTEARRGADVIVRLEPDHIRIWDFADEFDAGLGPVGTQASGPAEGGSTSPPVVVVAQTGGRCGVFGPHAVLSSVAV